MIDIEMEAKEIEEGETKDEGEEDVKPVEMEGISLLLTFVHGYFTAPCFTDEKEDADAPVSLQSNKVLLDSFLTTLSSCVNREMIDSAAIEFATNLNSKNNRKKLVRLEYMLIRNLRSVLISHF